MTDTIVALATPAGKSGVAVIRLSGSQVLQVAKYLGINRKLTPRMAHYVELKNPKNDTIIDKIIAIYFAAPNSFTGEDVLELHCHGSKAIIQEIIQVLLATDFVRHANAGEFTRRAVENGKMDLLQAEALADLINAETFAQRDLALRQMGSEVSSKFQELEQAIINARAFTEVHLDFPDDDIPSNIQEQINERIDDCVVQIQSLLATAKAGKAIRDGIKVVIAGVPNAGKSTLLNVMAEKKVAITSEMAGTTRDAISYYAEINNIMYHFVDTAGLRETTDEIESQGIIITKENVFDADIVFLVIDLTQELPQQFEQLKEIVSRETILIANKADLLSEELLQSQKNHIDDLCIVSRETIFISAKQIDAKAIIKNILQNHKNIVANNAIYVTRERHVIHLDAALQNLVMAQIELDMILKAQYLIYACNEVGMILGKINVEQVLDALFFNFCIGK
jgi:tRNA modification GTPase